jgi:hypothetical protein
MGKLVLMHAHAQDNVTPLPHGLSGFRHSPSPMTISTVRYYNTDPCSFFGVSAGIKGCSHDARDHRKSLVFLVSLFAALFASFFSPSLALSSPMEGGDTVDLKITPDMSPPPSSPLIAFTDRTLRYTHIPENHVEEPAILYDPLPLPFNSHLPPAITTNNTCFLAHEDPACDDDTLYSTPPSVTANAANANMDTPLTQDYQEPPHSLTVNTANDTTADMDMLLTQNHDLLPLPPSVTTNIDTNMPSTQDHKPLSLPPDSHMIPAISAGNTCLPANKDPAYDDHALRCTTECLRLVSQSLHLIECLYQGTLHRLLLNYQPTCDQPINSHSSATATSIRTNLQWTDEHEAG